MNENEIRKQLRDALRHNSIVIPSSNFLMGSYLSENEVPHTVYVPHFRLSKFLITKEQFALFLNTTRIENEAGGSYLYLNIFNKTNGITKSKGLYIVENRLKEHPVTCVNWFGAQAFATWVGGRLPTEAEWEKAAKGTVGEAIFPWGIKEPDQFLANYGENVGCTTIVGKYPPNGFKLYDMAGNASQWCSDWYEYGYYKRLIKDNPKGPSSGIDKVIRGGGWAYNSDFLRCAKRDKRWPRVGGTNLSFRIAFDVKSQKVK